MDSKQAKARKQLHIRTGLHAGKGLGDRIADLGLNLAFGFHRRKS